MIKETEQKKDGYEVWHICPFQTAGLYANPNITLDMLKESSHVVFCVKSNCQLWDSGRFKCAVGGE